MSRLLDLSLSLVDTVSLLSLSSSEGKEFMFDLEEKMYFKQLDICGIKIGDFKRLIYVRSLILVDS